MPIYGTLDVATRQDVTRAGKLGDLAWEEEGVEIANLTYEFDDTGSLELIPPALHPAIPFYGNVSVTRFPKSPVGPYTIAECRVMTRAGVHYGGFVTGAIIDSKDARDLLRDAYGNPARLGTVTLDHRHYGTELRAEVDGRTVLDARIEHPEPISSRDLMCTSSFYLADVEGERRLIQSEPIQKPELVERGTPHVRVFDGAGFGEPRIKLANALPATYMKGSVGFDPVRYLIDPTKPAIMGTKRI